MQPTGTGVTPPPASTPRRGSRRRDPAPPQRISWAQLGPEFVATWGRPRGEFQPEHLSVYGPSGSGKTHFVRWAVVERARTRGSHVVYLATKPADTVIRETGWPIINKWPPGYGKPQVIYWAAARDLSAASRREQQARVMALLDALWQPDSNIILVVDEMPYVVENLNLREYMGTYYREGRALGITVVAGMQRPAGVVRSAHSEPGWTVAFRPKDQDDAERVAEVFGHRQYYTDLLLDGLDAEKYEFLIRRHMTGEAYISRMPKSLPIVAAPRTSEHPGTRTARPAA